VSRSCHRLRGRADGFTLIELVITLALVGLISMAALPMYEVINTRLKESELRAALRTLRGALDAYKAASDAGTIEHEAGSSGYPPSLEVLVQGVDVGTKGAVTFSGKEAVQHLNFLRQIPRDPFNADPTVPAAQTWRLRAYASPADAPAPGADVFDVASTSTRTGLNGLPYASW
jgi:general secretion pathway protein G